jgi:hypothetical protein
LKKAESALSSLTALTVTGEDGESSSIGLKADGTATINGEQMEQGRVYELADGGTAQLDGNVLTTTTAEGYTISQTAHDGYIDAEVSTGENGVGNGQNPGGLLGHTFDADDEARNGTGMQGEGAIDGTVQDYEMASLTDIQQQDQTTQDQTTADTQGGLGSNFANLVR